MKTQLDDLKQEIVLCQKKKQEAINEANILKWRKYEDQEQKARTLIYNIR